MDVLAIKQGLLMGSDITNNALARMFSFEFLVWMAGALVAGTLAYSSLVAGQETQGVIVTAHTASIDALTSEQKEMREESQQTRTDIAVIKVQQAVITQDYIEVKRDIKEILQHIRERPEH